MQQLTYRGRQRRMAEAEQEAWAASATARAGYDERARLPLRLVVAPMRKFINQGGLLRTAEAFMVDQVDFSPEADDVYEFSGHQGTVAWQPYRWIDGLESLRELRAEGRTIYGLSLNDRATSVAAVEWRFPAALAVGEELDGLSPEWEAMCDEIIAIPMFGLVTSLNVAAATAVCLSSASLAYHAQNPTWRPIREASQRLLDRET
jgi:tRNA G18 (ribose-2'-O)-methylase SpoU